MAKSYGSVRPNEHMVRCVLKHKQFKELRLMAAEQGKAMAHLVYRYVLDGMKRDRKRKGIKSERDEQ